MLQLLDKNKNVINIGPFSSGFNLGFERFLDFLITTDQETPYRKYYIFNPDPISYENLKISIIPYDSNISNIHLYKIAKNYRGRPGIFVDYLNYLHYNNIPAYSYTKFWLKFDGSQADITMNPNTIKLLLTGESVA